MKVELNSCSLSIDWSKHKSICLLLQRCHSSINFSITSSDVLNGYGRREVYAVWLDVYVEVCRRCGRSSSYKKTWDKYDGECTTSITRHSWDKKFSTISSASSYKGFEDAFEMLEKQIKNKLENGEFTYE